MNVPIAREEPFRLNGCSIEWKPLLSRPADWAAKALQCSVRSLCLGVAIDIPPHGNDIITRVNNQPVHDADELFLLVGYSTFLPWAFNMKTFQRRAGALAATFSLRPRNCLVFGGLLALAFASWLLGGILAAAEPDAAQKERLKDPSVIAELVKQLGAASFSQRKAAQSELEKTGREALAPLRLAETSDDHEVKMRAKKTIAIIQKTIKDHAIRRLESAGFYLQKDGVTKEPTRLDRTSESHPDESALDVLRDLPDLTGVNFQGARFKSASLLKLGVLKKLQRVDIGTDGATDETLVAFQDMADLVSFEIEGCVLKRDGLKNLRNCKKLTRLGFRDSKIEDESLRAIQELPQLRRLDIVNCYLSNDALSNIGGLDQLDILMLMQIRGVTEMRIDNLKHLKNLRAIHLDGDLITDRDIDAILRLQKIEVVGLRGKKITRVGLLNLVRSKRLKSIFISSDLITAKDAELAHLEAGACSLNTDFDTSDLPPSK
ncbi:MAG TPA: hypothetical protein VFE24_05180 [Pirellulales bacterium]|nr:hypothetical protein [Pirellulales bacterium]